MKPRTLIVRTAGTNCDRETAYAFERAGADAEAVHINRLVEEPKLMGQFQMLAIPGGFSYGDDINSGRIFANQIMHHLRDQVQAFVAAGKPVIGICNGFQVLVKAGILPGTADGKMKQNCTLAHNTSGRFMDRWVTLVSHGDKCVWTRGLGSIELPIAHGEGRFVCESDQVRRALWANQQIALTYENENPNGSQDAIAGVCDSTGLVFGLMPHPERFVSGMQHPAWTRTQPVPDEGAGLAVFRNAVKAVK